MAFSLLQKSPKLKLTRASLYMAYVLCTCRKSSIAGKDQQTASGNQAAPHFYPAAEVAGGKIFVESKRVAALVAFLPSPLHGGPAAPTPLQAPLSVGGGCLCTPVNGLDTS